MQEQQHQIKIYGFLQKAVYAVVALDCASLFYLDADIPVVSNLLKNFSKMSFFYPPINAKFATVILIGLVAVGTKAKKKKDLNIATEIVIPMIFGLLMIFSSLVWQTDAGNSQLPRIFPGLNLYQVIYAVLSFLGAVILQMGADAISKLMQQKMGKDRWNVEEESFAQNQELVETDTSINIPYLFRYSKKINKGWVNINPFRGTMVIGTPGSGKSFGIINPAIRQMIAKGFCLCIYDFKFPDLAQIAYYHYLLKKSKDSGYEYDFHVINLNEVEKSKRVNPLKKEYIQTLAEAQEMAESMVSSLQKGGSSSGGGSDAFFTQSAINFLSSSIYFFATYEDGKYSDLPHILSFMNRSYKEIFDTLFTNEEIFSLLSPFKTAYENKAGNAVKLTISGRDPKGGTISQSFDFRVKNVPPPQGQVQGKNVVSMPASSIPNQKVAVVMPDFDFPVSFTVNSFMFKVPGRAAMMVTGNSMASVAALTKNLRSGDIAAVFNISATATGLGGQALKQIPPVIINVQ